MCGCSRIRMARVQCAAQRSASSPLLALAFSQLQRRSRLLASHPLLVTLLVMLWGPNAHAFESHNPQASHGKVSDMEESEMCLSILWFCRFVGKEGSDVVGRWAVVEWMGETERFVLVLVLVQLVRDPCSPRGERAPRFGGVAGSSVCTEYGE